MLQAAAHLRASAQPSTTAIKLMMIWVAVAQAIVRAPLPVMAPLIQSQEAKPQVVVPLLVIHAVHSKASVAANSTFVAPTTIAAAMREDSCNRETE